MSVLSVISPGESNDSGSVKTMYNALPFPYLLLDLVISSNKIYSYLEVVWWLRFPRRTYLETSALASWLPCCCLETLCLKPFLLFNRVTMLSSFQTRTYITLPAWVPSGLSNGGPFVQQPWALVVRRSSNFEDHQRIISVEVHP